MFDRLQYWRQLQENNAVRDRFVFDEPLACGIAMPEADMALINAQIFQIIASSMPDKTAQINPATAAGQSAIIDMLNATTRFSIDVKGQLDKFVGLELTLLNAFQRLNLMDGLAGIQFPVDIRVVHPQPPEGYLERRDAVDYLHCDPWRGEPADLINIVLYSVAGDDASQLELYSIGVDELPKFEAYAGEEKESHTLLNGRAPVQFQHRPGQLIMFDGYLPHRTRRLGNLVRISLNFSFRRLDPYSVIDNRWDRARQAWDKFWLLNDGSETDFSARMNAELERVRAISPEAFAARESSIARLRGVGSVSY